MFLFLLRDSSSFRPFFARILHQWLEKKGYFFYYKQYKNLRSQMISIGTYDYTHAFSKTHQMFILKKILID